MDAAELVVSVLDDILVEIVWWRTSLSPGGDRCTRRLSAAPPAQGELHQPVLFLWEHTYILKIYQVQDTYISSNAFRPHLGQNLTSYHPIALARVAKISERVVSLYLALQPPENPKRLFELPKLGYSWEGMQRHEQL